MEKLKLVETETHTPPPCPGCGALLHSVRCEVHEIYAFMPEAGYYNEKPDDIGNDYECPACGTDLSSVFPEGVVDWGLECIGVLSGGLEIYDMERALNTRICTICGDAVPIENLRAHLHSHNPNADGLDGHEILGFYGVLHEED